MTTPDQNKLPRFQAVILAYLDAAYNYAYWLTGDTHNAEDLTQEACMRAFAAFDNFKEHNPKAWLLTIVRNTFLSQSKVSRKIGQVIYIDEAGFKDQTASALHNPNTPEKILLKDLDIGLIRQCIDELAHEFREVIILRELEGFSYNEISQILECPIGTVMSRLSRARGQLKSKLATKDQFREGRA